MTEMDVDDASPEVVMALLTAAAEQGGVTSGGKLVVPPEWIRRVEVVLREASSAELARLDKVVERNRPGGLVVPVRKKREG
jgi:hypothetical protein